MTDEMRNDHKTEGGFVQHDLSQSGPAAQPSSSGSEAEPQSSGILREAQQSSPSPWTSASSSDASSNFSFSAPSAQPQSASLSGSWSAPSASSSSWTDPASSQPAHAPSAQPSYPSQPAHAAAQPGSAEPLASSWIPSQPAHAAQPTSGQQGTGFSAASPSPSPASSEPQNPSSWSSSSTYYQSQQSSQPQRPYYVPTGQAAPSASGQPVGSENTQGPQTSQTVADQAQQAYQQQVYQQYAHNAEGQHASPKRKVDPAKKAAARTFGLSFAGAALAIVIGLGIFTAYEAYLNANATGTTVTIDVTEDSTLAEAVAAKCLPSIVSIDVYETTSTSSQTIFGFEIPGTDDDTTTYTQTSLGSGVVITSDGYIITNNHVIEDADLIMCTVNGVEYEAEVVGADSSSDIAVLKVDATGLTAIEIGSSSDLAVGEWVMALGNPFGLENSVSTGVVSALQRSAVLQDETTGESVIYPNMIQTDATINPGNSGGALVDSEGKLIGINSMIQSTSGSSSGVGFAIPIDYAMGIAEQIMNGETPTHAQLGVSMVEITSSLAEYYGLATDTGVYVANVYADTAADEAGIQAGDIIIAFDGVEVTSASDLQLAVRSKNPGDTVEVIINRDGEEITLSVTLGDDEDTLGTSDDTSDTYGYGTDEYYEDYPYGYGY